MALKLYLLAFLLVNLGLTFVWSSVRVYKKTGINPITFQNSDSAHDYAGQLFKITLVGLLLIVLMYVLGDRLYGYLLPFWYLEYQGLRIAGLLLLHISLVWILVAQLQMGESWRIGIDETHRTELKTGGVFSLSRNPIFLGMLVSLLGLFLVIPNAFSLLVLVVGYVLIGIQVRLEEAYLEKRHGGVYQQYQRRVRRWI